MMNGSPEPVFRTDDERSYFLTVLRVHPEAQVEKVIGLTDTQVKILSECAIKPMSKREMAEILGHSNVSGNLKKAITELLSNGLLDYTIPEKPRGRLQRYQTTVSGRKLIKKTEFSVALFLILFYTVPIDFFHTYLFKIVI